jgi:MFS transporter, PPP family, 3-phenylpropionic acid transporter
MSALAPGRLRGTPGVAGALFYFCFYGAVAAFIPFVSVYYARRGLSGSEIGLLAATGPLMSVLVAPALSALADRHGRRVLLLCLGLAGMALGLLAIPLPSTFAGLLAVVVLMTAAASPVVPVADALLSRLAARRGLSFGKIRMWGSLAWALVASGCGALWQVTGLVWMFPVSCVLLLATIPVAAMIEEERPSEDKVRPPLRLVVADRRMRVLLAATFALGLSLYVGITFSSIYLDALSGQLLVGIFAGTRALSELPMMLWSERVMQRLGGPWSLALSFALFAGANIGIAWLNSPVLLLGAAAMQGAAFGLFMPVTVRLIGEWAPAEWTATSMGILAAGFSGLAPLIAGPLGGMLYDSAGPQAVFLACAVAAGLAGVVIIVARLAGVFEEPEVRIQKSEVSLPTSDL